MALKPKIALVGEAWGAFEADAKLPFQGPAGQQLDSLISQLGRKRSEFYITNVINERPPKDNFGVYYEDKNRKNPTDRLSNRWIELQEELAELKPNIVIALGAEALRALTHLRGLEKWRGSLLRSSLWDFKVLATYHPSMLTRGGRTGKGYPVRPIMLLDFKKALKHSKTPELKLKERTRLIDPTRDQIKDWLVRDYTKLAVDIETEAGQISCIGFADSPTNSICVPFIGATNTHYGDHKFIWELINYTLADPEVEVIGQNFSYDMTWLEERYGVKAANYAFDTYVGMNCVMSEFPYSLAFMTSIFTDMPYYKDDNKEHKRIRDYTKHWNYNCSDVLATFEVAEKLRTEIELGDLQEMFDRRMETYKTMHQIGRRGLNFNHQLRKKLRGQSRKRLREMESSMLKEIDKTEFNFKSDAQIRKLCIDEWKIKPYLKQGKPTFDETALKKLAVKYPKRKWFSMMVDYRKEKSLYEKELNTKIDDDGKIRCMYGITETGRLRSSGNAFHTGRNLQNVPKEMRVLFLPDAGHVFVEVDLSQAEARVVAYESKDPSLIKLFESGGDIHKQNAANIFGLPLSKVTQRERQLGKKVAHATNYGMGARTMVESIIKELGVAFAIKESEARIFQANYHRAYPYVKEWQNEIIETLKTTRTLSNCFGSSRFFSGPMDEKTFKEGFAWVPQSTVADTLDEGLKHWENRSPLVKENNCMPILLQVHDSVLIQIPMSGQVFSTMEWDRFKKYFEIPITIKEQTITIPIDIKIGKNWKEMEDVGK